MAKEKEIFQILVLKLKPLLQTIKTLGELISEFDVLHNFALISLEYDYIKPEIVKDKELEITGLRHPVLSSRLGHNYQNNDVKLNTHKSIILITGPNMSGKSTYIRSIAICSLLAQIGSYVPASSAKLTLVDGIYTRIGSSDNINQNESTFMVEMIEMAYILNHATTKSLIILDEVGRGTSTYDGVALAWALVEYLAVQITGFCLFATHYHELIELEKNIPNIVNYYVEAIPGEKLTFTHKVLKGSLNKSFGVQVAEMAGINAKVIVRAKQILNSLEKANNMKKIDKPGANISHPQLIMQLPEVNSNRAQLEQLDKLKKLDLTNLTPLDAFSYLVKFQQEQV